jgi:uncharacterized membrane protein YgcG
MAPITLWLATTTTAARLATLLDKLDMAPITLSRRVASRAAVVIVANQRVIGAISSLSRRVASRAAGSNNPLTSNDNYGSNTGRSTGGYGSSDTYGGTTGGGAASVAAVVVIARQRVVGAIAGLPRGATGSAAVGIPVAPLGRPAMAPTTL